MPFPPEQYELQGAEAAARGEVVDWRGNLSMGDKYGQSLAWDRIQMDRLRAGELPLWTNDIAGGAPFIPQMAQPFQPWNLLLTLVDSAEIYGLWYFLHLVLFGWLAYRFLRRIDCVHEGALVGVVAVVLGMWTQCKLHHNVILTSALSLFPMLSAVSAIARGGGRREIGALAIWTALTWCTGFVIVSLQIAYVVVAWAVMSCLRNDAGARLRPLLLCGCGLALGGVIASAQMLPVLFAAAGSARVAPTAEDLARTALEWDYAWTLLWPDLLAWPREVFLGDAHEVRPTWARLGLLDLSNSRDFAFPETSFSVGCAIFCLVFACFGAKGQRAVACFFAGVAGFAWLLSTHTPVVYELATLLPRLTGTDLKRNLFLVALALPVLAALGATRLARGRRSYATIVALGVVASVSLGGWLMFRTFGNDHLVALLAGMMEAKPEVDAPLEALKRGIEAAALPGEIEANLEMLRTTFARTFFVAGAACVSFFVFPARWSVLVVALCGAVELAHAGRGGVVTVAPERITTPPAIVAPVLAAEPEAPGVRPRMFRVFAENAPGLEPPYPPNLGAFHGIEDATNYQPLPSRRMSEFFAAVDPNSLVPGAAVAGLRDAGRITHPLLDLFGVRFVLSGRSLDTAGLVDRTPGSTPAPYRLYERTTALPRATFVTGVEVFADPDARLAELARPDRDVATTVILEDPDAPSVDPSVAKASVEILDRRDEHVTIRVVTDRPGYLRLADPWDAGWIATVDGEGAPVFVADHYLRAVHVPAGEHEVAFHYRGWRVVGPLWLGALGLLVAVGLWVLGRRD